jgi:hypothetical protein
MSDHRDRAEVQEFCVDDHVKAVLGFMQANVPSSKLCGVANSLPQMARLLWGNFKQEPFAGVRLTVPKTDQGHPSQLSATESSLARSSAGDGSVVEATSR